MHPGGCTSGETLSCGSTASRRAAEAVWLPRLATRPRTTRRRAGRRIESAMEADDVERARVESNRRAREEAGAALQPRAGGFEDLPVGETTTGDNDADVGGSSSSSSTRPEARGAVLSRE